MLETGAGKPPLKKKESGGSSVRGAIKRRLTVHTSDVVDALDKIKSFSRGGYLLKIERPPPDKEASAEHECVVVKWRAPIDHHTSDWIGIWPVGSKPVRKLGRVLASSSSEDTPTRSHSSQPVVGKCWAFVPKGKKGIITFSGDRLPTSEGKYCLNYVVEGDPWSEQSIAFSGPEFNISGDSDKGSTALSPRQELKTSSGTSPLSPRSGSPGLTFSLSTEVSTVMDEEERHRAWREDWMAAVDEADQSRLIEWETGRIPPRTGQTLAELTFKVPSLFRSLRHRGGSSSESESEDGDEDSLAAEDSATEESDSTKRRKRKEQERMLKMKSEGGMLDIWRRTSRGKREASLLKSSSETEPEGGEPASHSLASAVSFNVVPTISTESDDILGGEPAKHEKLRRGGSLRRKKHDPTTNLIHSSPSSIPVFQVTPPSSFSEASPALESHTVPSSPSGSFIVLSSPSSSLSTVPTIGDNENAQVLPSSGGGEPTKSSKKKKKKGSSSVKTAASNEARSPLLTTNTTTTTTTTTQPTSVPASSSSGDVVIRPVAQREADASLASMPSALKSDIGSEPRVTPSSDTDSRAKLEQEQEGSRRGRKGAASSANKVPCPTAAGEDLFGVRKRYQVEIGPVIFSEDFVFYFLIFALIVFVIFHNALHELRLLLPASNK